MIALSHGYSPLFFGRLLQGMSGGSIGVVVPLYLAECLSPPSVARARAYFSGCSPWALSLPLVGIYFSYRVEAVAQTRRARPL